ncbi:MAG: HAMP domain-containing sensor histidine kinase [Nocardioidaceae bacterium]
MGSSTPREGPKAPAPPTDMQEAVSYWLSLQQAERGTLQTPLGEATYIAIPLRGRGADGLFLAANFPAFERGEIDKAVSTQTLIQLGTIVLAALLGLALAGRVLRPLRSLAETARRISDTDLSQRIPTPGKDEASQIGVAFNDMLTRLETAFITQRQFLDDTSHELRTPLTVIRGHVEMLELDNTEREREETIALVTDEIDRMGNIINDLSTLARAEHPGFLTLEAIDLRSLVRDLYLKATTLDARQWHLQAEVPVHAVVDRHRITQAMLQLAHNATRFTTEADDITIGSTCTSAAPVSGWTTAVSGVDPGDAEAIFDRFQRGANSANSAGRGLGLAIVRAIAQAHGGEVYVVPRPGPGTRFELVLPTAAPQGADPRR